MKLAAIAAGMFLLVQTPQPAPKASIEGTIVRVGTGEPVAGAQVSLGRVLASAGAISGPTRGVLSLNPVSPSIDGPVGIGAITTPAAVRPGLPEPIPSVTSDRQGRFVLTNLEPGSYQLTAAMNGYVRQSYGQRVAGGPNSLVVLAEGQVLKDVAIRLTPTGALSGRIRDDVGDPLAGVDVQVLRSGYNANGEKTFLTAGSARTDDRGDYRAFWITPGRYYVLAGAVLPRIAQGISSNEVPVQRITSTYYPNETDVSRASRLDLQPGAEMGGIDFQLSRQNLYRIRGSIVDARTGQAPASAFITLVTPTIGGSLGRGVSQSYNPANGTFELRDIVPGTYVVQVELPPVPGVRSPEAGNGSVRAQVFVNVSRSDVENVILNVFPGASISGRLIVEGETLASLVGLRVALRPSVDGIIQTSLQGPPPQPQATRADGTFAIDNVTPGEYRISVPLPPNYYVKEARFDQSDVLNQPMLFSGRVSGTLDVVISSKSAQVDGVVVDAQSRPVPGIQAVLIPDRSRNRSDLYQTVMTDQNGHFMFRGISPGDYKLFSWESLEPFGYFDPDLLRTLEQEGKQVHLAESSRATVEVKVIPAAGQ